MKSFWRRPPKKKHKQKVTSKQHPASSQARPEPWTPPHPIKPKTSVTGEVSLTAAPVTYQIPPAPAFAEEPPVETIEPEQKKARPRDRQAYKEFLQIFRSLTGKWRAFDIWSDFITMSACAISNSVDKSHFDVREELYLRIIRRYSKEEQALFPKLLACTAAALEEDPEQDFLGSLYMELGLEERSKDQFFTPYHVCHLMAEITYGDLVGEVREKGYVEIHDCCCGAGATLIAAANVARQKLEKTDMNFQNHILISGQDIDPVVTMMCYIQLSLLGVAGYFKVGNSLVEPMVAGDSLEQYWFTPMYFFPVWQLRRQMGQVLKLFNSERNEEI